MLFRSVIILSDVNTSTGVSNGALAALGFDINTTDGCKYGPSTSLAFTGVASTAVSGVGSNATFNVNVFNGIYLLASGTPVAAGGSGYAVGDQVKITGNHLGGTTPGNDLVLTVTAVSTGAITGVAISSGTAIVQFTTQLSNWYPLTYTAKADAPDVAPANNTNWFYSVDNQVDVMVNYGGAWFGYRNKNYDTSGFPTTGTNLTDPNGPICQASEPTTQSDGTDLVYGDLWINTGDLENYPVIYRWEAVEIGRAHV